MNFKKTISLLVVFFMYYFAWSQSYFNRLDSSYFLYESIGVVNNEYLIAGGLWGVGGSTTVFISKSSNIGDPIEVDTLNEYPILSSGANVLIYNTKFIVCNVINSIPPFSSINKNIEISSYSSIGIQEWAQIFGENNYQDQPSNIIRSSNNFIYMLGSTLSYGAGDSDFYLVKLDTFGNVIWEKTYGDLNSEIAYSINETLEGDIILSGFSNSFSGDWDIYVVKINQDGDLSWQKNYDNGNSDWGGGLTITTDNSFILYHNIDYPDNSTTGQIEKYDGNGNLVWSKTFTSNNSYTSFSFSKPIENENGTILVNSIIRNNNGIDINRLLMLDPFGNTLWYKDYYTRDDIHQYIYDIKPTTDGGYIMAGSAFPVNVNQQHAWLIKTNCNGEDGVQYPITGAACTQYDCTLYPIDANFTANKYIVDLAETNGDVEFTNTSANTTSRVWNFGDGVMDYTDAVLTHTYQTEGTYQAQLITFHGTCSDTTTQTIEVINSLGINDNSTQNLLGGAVSELVELYPNPSNGEFTIEFSHPATATAQIIDVTGRVVSIIDISDAQSSYQISHLVTGVYFIIINYGDGLVESKRIVIQ